MSWRLADLPTAAADAPTVMSTFACGGGSSMGYKLAGFRVVAANDIDPQMAIHYKRNLGTPLFIEAPISDVVDMARAGQLPPELYDLDVLDGSPPCSTFSTSGNREKAWGVEKKFREGQATQVLSDLFFDYLDLVDALKPKFAVAENVKGMLAGNARGYVKLIMTRFDALGYDAQLFLVNAADCGEPQTRERVFFVARRRDLGLPRVELPPARAWVTLREALADVPAPSVEELASLRVSDRLARCWEMTPPGKLMGAAHLAVYGKEGAWDRGRLSWELPSRTLMANGHTITHPDEPRYMSAREFARLGGFPDDYAADSEDLLRYMVGMSVPPGMMRVVAGAVLRSLRGVE